MAYASAGLFRRCFPPSVAVFRRREDWREGERDEETECVHMRGARAEVAESSEVGVGV